MSTTYLYRGQQFSSARKLAEATGKSHTTIQNWIKIGKVTKVDQSNENSLKLSAQQSRRNADKTRKWGLSARTLFTAFQKEVAANHQHLLTTTKQQVCSILQASKFSPMAIGLHGLNYCVQSLIEALSEPSGTTQDGPQASNTIPMDDDLLEACLEHWQDHQNLFKIAYRKAEYMLKRGLDKDRFVNGFHDSSVSSLFYPPIAASNVSYSHFKKPEALKDTFALSNYQYLTYTTVDNPQARNSTLKDAMIFKFSQNPSEEEFKDVEATLQDYYPESNYYTERLLDLADQHYLQATTKHLSHTYELQAHLTINLALSMASDELLAQVRLLVYNLIDAGLMTDDDIIPFCMNKLELSQSGIATVLTYIIERRTAEFKQK